MEIEYNGQYFYVVVLTKVVMFGGNILFTFHNGGKKCEISTLTPDSSGFNICADLLPPKRKGLVVRLGHYDDIAAFWRSKYVKSTNEYRLGVKSNDWYIGDIRDLTGPSIARVAKLTPEYSKAMDGSC